MASTAQCIFCFEVLDAYLSNRSPLSLQEVQDSWDSFLKATTTTAAKQNPALRHLAAKTPAAATNSSGSSSATDSPALSTVPSSSSSTLSLATSTAATSTTSLTDNSSSTTATAAAASPTDEFPLFVTWNTLSPRSRRRSLRGCIGTFEAQPLAETLASYAITSAIHDTRFDPIDDDELPVLEAAVTLLTDFETADADDWTVGKHGLRISFVHRGRRHSATYLPDVAAEQGWTKEETLVSLMRKAGWMGSRSSWRDVSLKVERYQGSKAKAEYAEYKKWVEWRDGA